MHTKKDKDLKKIKSIWDTFLDSQGELLKKSLTDLEISALYTGIEDTFESFHEIFFILIPALQKSFKRKDYDAMQSNILDIYWAFDHVKNHIQDASKGFLEMSKKLEQKEKELKDK